MSETEGERFRRLAHDTLRRVGEAPKRKQKKVLENEFEKLPPDLRDTLAAWTVTLDFVNTKKTMSNERKAAFGAGVTFLVILLGVTVIIPNHTPSQARIFNTVLALAASGFGVLIPGFLDVKISAGKRNTIRAVGAVALFVIVYFWKPA